MPEGMKGLESFELARWDYLAFIAYFVMISLIGFWAGRKKKQSDDYFLAGRSLPWYVVGCSFIASNISSEQFIGMIGAAFIYGICVAFWEWGNVATFSILVWIFIPFLLASKVFTAPEFMERRFNNVLRQAFAVITVLANVLAFLAAVLYGGGLALNKLFGDSLDHFMRPVASLFHEAGQVPDVLAHYNLWFAIVIVAVASGLWTIYGGLKSAAWMDVFTVVIMIVGGLLVTLYGLASLADGNPLEGFKVMIERNQAETGAYAEVVSQNAQNMAGQDHYNRLSVIQPVTHTFVPWPNLFLMIFSISIWYNVINQFMIQRVLGAKSMYHARMGIVLAGYMKVILPFITVVPGLILFAKHPEIMRLPWKTIQTEADKGYVHMLQTMIPIGLRGLFLAALFGAIQSTVQAVLNSTSTVFTMDIYQRMWHPKASDRHLVTVGRISTAFILIVSIVLAGFIPLLKMGLFEYIQSLFAFFAPPFGAIFLLGILFRRINAPGATAAVFGGFLFATVLKLYIWLVPDCPKWITPFLSQATLTWFFSVTLCVSVSAFTAPPRREQVTDDLTINWRKLNIFSDLGRHWYTHVVLWWGLFVLLIAGLIVIFSGVWL